LSGKIDDRERPGVVAAGRQIDEGDPIAPGRHADQADPPGRLVEDLADWDLEPVLSADLVDDREGLPVGRPVGFGDVLEDLPRRSAGERYRREGAGVFPSRCEAAVGRNGELAVLLDRKNVPPGDAGGGRIPALRGRPGDVR